MPTIELTNDCLIVHLSRLEKFQSLSGDITIALEDVRGATEDKGATADLGFRAPGTHIPGRLWAGTFIKLEKPLEDHSQPKFVYAVVPGLPAKFSKPGIYVAGQYLGEVSPGFVLVKAPMTPVVITVNHKKWSRLVIGVSNPRELVKQINSAIAK